MTPEQQRTELQRRKQSTERDEGQSPQATAEIDVTRGHHAAAGADAASVSDMEDSVSQFADAPGDDGSNSNESESSESSDDGDVRRRKRRTSQHGNSISRRMTYGDEAATSS